MFWVWSRCGDLDELEARQLDQPLAGCPSHLYYRGLEGFGPADRLPYCHTGLGRAPSFMSRSTAVMKPV